MFGEIRETMNEQLFMLLCVEKIRESSTREKICTTEHSISMYDIRQI